MTIATAANLSANERSFQADPKTHIFFILHQHKSGLVMITWGQRLLVEGLD